MQNLINKGVAKVIELKNALNKGSLTEIRTEVGSIYPEKIVFDGSKVRTVRRNDFIQHINSINKKLQANKNGTKIDFSTLSRQVGVTGPISNQYLEDLMEIQRLRHLINTNDAL